MGAPSKLTFALGKREDGFYLYCDLSRAPHLLIGGSTNSGKSVFLHSLIISILYRATPREVKFVMIDTKRIELSPYAGIPHLLCPVIKDVKQATGIFRSVVKEMEDRYDRFARLGTRNIEGFNTHVPPDERLPFIVVVVDELADMMQQEPEVEKSICRIAQLARATGIHLVIATQRPSVDVITGTIKANLSSRIAFAVATQIDSRTILDMGGAEHLIGRGDMLYMPIDAAKPVRVQGCYVGERETEELVKYLRSQEEGVYTLLPSEPNAGSLSDDANDSNDELFEPCVRWLVTQGQCSTSALQRKFKIGYTRAALLVDLMEVQGIVGPQIGVKPRVILLRPENIAAYFAKIHERAHTFRNIHQTYPMPISTAAPQKDMQQAPVPQAKPEKSASSSDTLVLLDKLNGLTGLNDVKAEVTQLTNFLRVQQMRKQKGLSVPDQSLHMVFTGNPGTGKTTIARLIANIYKSMGILSEGQFIETDRTGLIGGYLGQTGLKTKAVVESALGGVLFIDEAYSLTQRGMANGDAYGEEAVNTLLKLMEDYRDDLIVIVAGYTEPMQKFIKSNPGLQSRFSKFLHFDDYAPGELTEIFRHFAAQGDYKLHPATELKLFHVFTELYARRDETFGNARLARNLFEKAINAHANRMVSAGALDEASLVTLFPEDVPAP